VSSVISRVSIAECGDGIGQCDGRLDSFLGAQSILKTLDYHSVMFLASEKASYITGVNLLVCGGLNLGNLW
jgi:hypothetical protein